MPATKKEFPRVKFARGDLVFQEGQAADHMYLVQSGEIEIFQEALGIVIATLGKGQAFGEQALIVQSVRTTSARALSDSECLLICPERLREALHNTRDLSRSGIEALLLQLCMNNELLGQAAQNSFPVNAVHPEVAKVAKQNNPRTAEEFLQSEKGRALPTREGLLLRLVAGAKLRDVSFGVEQTLIPVGFYPEEAYVVLDGQITCTYPRYGRCVLGPGSVVGLAEGLTESRFTAKVVTSVRVTALRLPVHVIRSSLRVGNSGLRGIARIATQRILGTDTVEI
jgi:CRP-like cAMP-binding protein